MIKKTGTESCHLRIWYSYDGNNSILKKKKETETVRSSLYQTRRGKKWSEIQRVCCTLLSNLFFFFFLETISEQLIWRTLIMAEKRMFNTKISLSLLECNGWFTIFFSFFIDTMTFIQRTEKEIEIRHVLIMKRSLRGNFFQFFYD